GTSALSGSPLRSEVTLSQVITAQIGALDARPLGMGGWLLSPHHVYDPVAQELHLGTGQRRRAEALGSIIRNVPLKNPNGTPATMNGIQQIVVGPDGTVFAQIRAFPGQGRLRRIAPDGTVFPLGFIDDNTQYGLALAPDGSLYVAQEAATGVGLNGGKLTRITADGTMTIVAGTGVAGFSGDGGPANLAQLARLRDVAVAPDGTVYVADAGNVRIRRIGTDGIITTIAGDGTTDFGGDGGPASQAKIGEPFKLAIGPDGSLYFNDFQANRIRRISPDGIVRTVVGSGGDNCIPPEDCGDGGPATAARMDKGLGGITIDKDGSIYIAEARPQTIRKVGPDGIIRRFAGRGPEATATFVDGMLALQASLNPLANIHFDVAIAPDGSAYIADDNGQQLLKRVTSPFSKSSGVDLLVASEDARQLYVFDAAGRHLRTLDGLTNAVLHEFTYDAGGRLATVIQKTGGTDNVTTIQHDVNGKPVKIIGPYGQETLLAVDANGFLASIANPAGEAIQLASTPLGLLQTFSDPRGNASQYAYDSLGNLVQATPPGGGTQTFARTDFANGYSVTKTTALGRATTYKVENLATGERKLTTTAPGGEATVVRRLPDGTSIAATPDGTFTTVTLGPDPRFGMQAPVPITIEVKRPGGITRFTQNNVSATLADPEDLLSLATLMRTSSTNGRTTTSTYTAATRTANITTSQGRTSSITIDALGRRATSQTAGLAATSRTYDSRGRLASITAGSGPGARTLLYGYDAQGNAQTVTDPSGRTVQFAYDAAGRVTSKTLPDGRIANFSYDPAGNLATLTPPGKPAYSFSYSTRNEPTADTPPVVAGTGPTAYSYDNDRALTVLTRPGSRTIAVGYDAAGRRTTRTLATNGVVSGIDAATYDIRGRVAGVAASSGVSVSYGYDGAFVTGETSSGAIVGALTRSYDADFRLVSQTVNGANAIAFSYDADNWLTAAGALAITRDAQNGRPTSAAAGVTSSAIGYNNFGELVDYTASQNASPLYSFTLTRNALGRVTQKVETLGGVTDTYVYTHDLAGQLVGVTRNGTASEGYVYDTNGNRTSATVLGAPATGTYDAQDRMTQYGAATYSYSAAGELAGKTVGAQSTAYQYDSLGNLLSVALPNATVISYAVDGLGRRVGKRINGTLVKGFLYGDQLRPLVELDGANNVASRFVYAGGNAPVLMVKAGTTFRILTDHVGSVRMVVNATSGAVAQRIDYDTFGNVVQDSNPGFQPFGFGGGIYDLDTGLVRFGARDYDAATGRWTVRDPIGFRGGDGNQYRYVSNDPANRSDPFGTSELDDEIKWFEETIKAIEKRLTPSPPPTIIVEEGLAAETVVDQGLKDLVFDYAVHLSRLKSIKWLFGPEVGAVVVVGVSCYGLDARANEAGRTVAEQFHEERQVEKDSFIQGFKDNVVGPLTDFFRDTFGGLFVR
ncbi:MAG: RHS repeat-associated core domain-containing protein, partial [Betaproteobacteria bacterium]